MPGAHTSLSRQASRDAHTMLGVCWLHMLFCMFVALFAAVVPRSLVVVVVGVGVVMVVQPNGNRIECVWSISLAPYV